MGSAVVSIPTRSRDVPPTSLLHSPLAHQTVSGIGHTSCSARRRTERPGRSRSPFPTASFRLRRGQAAFRLLVVDSLLFQSLPKRRKFSRSEIRQNPAIHVNHRRLRLAGQPIHLVVSLLVRNDVQNLVLDAVIV